MTARRLPAYGRALLERRRGGDHPLEVVLLYGQDWWKAFNELPRLALAPEDYEPGRFDLSVVAGLKCTVIDQVGGALIDFLTRGPEQYGVFYDLVRELAAADAYVEIMWPTWCRRPPASAMGLAIECRARRAWPRWWSDELDEKQTRRFERWCLDAVARNQRRLTERERGRAA